MRRHRGRIHGTGIVGGAAAAQSRRSLRWRARARAHDAGVLLWLVDDSPHHHAVAAATAARVAGIRFAGFLTAAGATAAFARAARGRGASVPDVVLMDYYLGDGRGDQVTRRLRQLEPRTRRPVIIGYSSVRSGSEAIVAAGGDLILRKTGDAEAGNPELLAWLEAAAR